MSSTISFPLLPLIVMVALALVALYFRQRLVVGGLVVFAIALYTEHYNRQILRKNTCLKHASFQIEGKPTPFFGVYVRLSQKFTWQDLETVFLELPLNRYGKSTLPLTFVDADIAKSNFHEPERHRFAREVFHSNRICWPRPKSPWLKNEEFLNTHERLKRSGICFRITPVKEPSEVRKADCWGHSSWSRCEFTEATRENLSIPTFAIERKKIEVVAWPSRMSVELVARLLESSDGSWSARSTTVQYGPELDSWLSRMLGWFGGSRTFSSSCFGNPLLPTVFQVMESRAH